MNNISFVIPAFNCADTIEESVDSIFGGNFEPGDEVIIVNDASTDGTSVAIAKLKLKYPGIVAVSNNRNLGCPATRNVGIRRALNPLIFNLDADNILVPGSVRKLKETLLKENADVAAFSAERHFRGNDKKVTHSWIYDRPTLTLADFLAGPVNPGPGGNFLYRKDSWEKIGGYWEYGKGLHCEWGFTLKQLANGAKFSVVPHTYYLHRYGIDSLFDRESRKQDESSLMATKMISPYLGLLREDDAARIASEEGSKKWFDDFNKNPIRLKTGEVGQTGYIKRPLTIMLKMKIVKIFPEIFSKYQRLKKFAFSSSKNSEIKTTFGNKTDNGQKP